MLRPPSDVNKLPARKWEAFLNRPVFTHRALACSTVLSGKTILVTGAGGSIGSVVSLLLMGGLAKRLILLDRSVSSLLALQRRYQGRHVVLPRVDIIQADILDAKTVQAICQEHPPDVIFHTAALKHLVALESTPFQALETNVLGMIRILEIADFFHVQHLVNISTDKAVNPTSVLGVSKRISELLLLAFDPSAICTRSLRLGNVLGSSESVVHAFVRAVENHQPFTVTDPQAQRYFITMDEAAAFLLEALNIRESSLLIPEMGSPRRIVDLIAFLMRDLQLDFSRVAIVEIGMRDGEKKIEQLTYDYEYRKTTTVPKLYQLGGTTIADTEKLAYDIGRMLDFVLDRRVKSLIKALQDIVPEFQPSATLLRGFG